jgi:hypothetical protein
MKFKGFEVIYGPFHAREGLWEKLWEIIQYNLFLGVF